MLPIVSQLVNVGPEIVHLVTGDGDIGGAGIVRADVDRVHHRAVQIAGRHVLPVRAIITSHVNQAIVAADPDRAALMR